jgi:hypothetical protein
MNPNWLDLLTAAFSGGLFLKLLDYAYGEYKRRSEASKSAKDLINKHIDPIPKAGDELVGKIRSLAQRDFREIQPKQSESVGRGTPKLEVIYLFSQFWARVQILRQESIYLNLSADTTGRSLIMFLRAMEATRTRLVDRAWQRGMGEAVITKDKNGLSTMSYYDFVEKYIANEQFRAWFQPIMTLLNRMNHTRERQRLLVYAVIFHVLIDTLDPGHLVTRDRPGWSNKFSSRSRKELRFRVFKIYLSFVKDPERYFKVMQGRNIDNNKTSVR